MVVVVVEMIELAIRCKGWAYMAAGLQLGLIGFGLRCYFKFDSVWFEFDRIYTCAPQL
jgi:hypothetical protein